MKRVLILPVVSMIALNLLAEEVAFKGELPGKGWKKAGGLIPRVIDDAGRRVLELKDNSTSDSIGYNYDLPDKVAARAAQDGFSVELCVKPVSGALDGLLVRLKNVGNVSLTLTRDEKKKQLIIGSYDYGEKKQLTAVVKRLDEYVTLKALYAPKQSSLTIFVDGKQVLAFSQSNSDVPRNIIELGGGRDLTRQGRWLVESFRFTTGGAKP